MSDIKPGSIIRSSRWDEPVQVAHVEDLGEYVRIVGSTINSRIHIDDLIPKNESDTITVESIETFFTEEPWKVFLALETTRYRFASLYDPLLAMNTSKVDPLPHQIEAVYGRILNFPRIRFLIADDPGAGKTIMAGLIIKELKLRNLIKRTLIVVPGHLKDQWKRELKDRFQETFVPIDRGLINALYAENAWMKENQIITSIDFIKQESIIPSIAASQFDLIICDEAHKMAAYKYGEKTSKTARYQLGEVLSRITEHMLFLTATPHRGDSENFRLFLDLLEPGFFATNEMLQESIKSQENMLFIRRVKEDMKDFEGKPLFLPRHVKTVSFKLGEKSPNEKELYNKLSEYVETQYNKALEQDKKRNVAFALVILQRRLASSTYALFMSLKRRKKRLEDLLKGAENHKEKGKEIKIDFDEVEDLSEEDRWEQEGIWETLSVAENKEELQKEILTVDSLIERANAIIKGEQEIKLSELKKALKELTEKYPERSDKKVLIFTESRDTLDYLEGKIKEWGYAVNTIHGGMKLEDRVLAEKIFKNETDVLVATEAAGEGINLQFCHLMINYDIPWNPNRLEQRMGRIHRYGQQKEVYVQNLVAADTREGQVLNRLFEKLDEIRDKLGSDKVFDVLGEILYDISLSQLLTEAAANARGMSEILNEIEIIIDEDYINGVLSSLEESLATHFIDYTRIKDMAQKAREHRLIPEYTESYFRKAYEKAGGKIREGKDGFLAIESIPAVIKNIADNDLFKKRYGELIKKYPRITFDKDTAFKNPETEFVCFGHPLFEAVMGWVEKHLKDSLIRGATFIDLTGRLDGYILFYEGEVKDGKGEVAGKRLFGLYTDGDRVIAITPALIWDLAEGDGNGTDVVDVDALKKRTLKFAVSRLEEYKAELLIERKRQVRIKEKYGTKSLDYLIVRLDGDLIKFQERKDVGENVDLVMRNKREALDKYQGALVELKDTIEKEQSLTMSMPRFFGIIKVIPAQNVDSEMEEDPEIEKIGMDVAMKYEVKQGRTPEDVGDQDLGFDIRSRDKNGNTRYIEVKARVTTGAVSLTRNEWFKAMRFKDEYFLYAVMNAGSNPRLYIIKNPAEILKASEKIDVRYIVTFDEIRNKGDIEVG